MPKHVTLDHSTASVNIQRIYPIDLTPEDNISVQEKSGTEQWIVVIISQPSCLRFDPARGRRFSLSPIANRIYVENMWLYGTCTIPTLWTACFSVTWNALGYHMIIKRKLRKTQHEPK